MEYLILGLLILSPMTGYELQQFIRQNLALICSHSAGSVQAALRKLEQGGVYHRRRVPGGEAPEKDLLQHGGGPSRFFCLGGPAHAGGTR